MFEKCAWSARVINVNTHRIQTYNGENSSVRVADCDLATSSSHTITESNIV